jgi:hypothetical protein
MPEPARLACHPDVNRDSPERRHVSDSDRIPGLRVTPFHPRTRDLSQSQGWRRWAGYLSATSYELTHDREYSAVRSSAALFDVTPLKKWIEKLASMVSASAHFL